MISFRIVRCELGISKFCTVEADGKNNDKASATRSKHSVTEQRRRSKINERHVSITITAIFDSVVLCN